MKPLEIYIHIPFCIRKCKYCDFLSAPSTEEERQNYVKSLCQHIRSYTELAEAYHVVSVFVGGGTPSLLTGTQMQAIFDALFRTFHMDGNPEVSVEVNPGTVAKEKLKSYAKAGINRISIGLQSTDNQELRILGRIHTYEDFLYTYRLAREEGFRNINVDLMSAIPHQTNAGWVETLRKVAELNPEHISAYSLMIEEGTPFYERYKAGKYAEELPDEETERAMYHSTAQVLREYGYYRYEISNYAKPGYACRHNLGYWNRTEYLGIGTGAASLIDNRRWVEGETPKLLTVQNQMEEFMFLGLRKMEGVLIKSFEQAFHCRLSQVYGKVLADMKAKGLIEEADGYIRLTKRGIDLSNYVMSEFLL